jgi:hypothetical protein
MPNRSYQKRLMMLWSIKTAETAMQSHRAKSIEQQIFVNMA